MKWRATLFALVAVLALANVGAATYSLEPVADARVLSLPGFDNNNYGADILSCYTESSALNTQRTFIQFDLSSITVAPTQVVQSATLTLTASTSFGNNTNHLPMQIYRLLSPWNESGVTWAKRDSTEVWTNPGGDFVGLGSQPYAISTASPSDGEAVTWDVTALVREWANHEATNYGLMLKSESGNHLTFSQRESQTAALRPNLTVVVVPVLPPFHSYSTNGQVVLWWTSANAVLQEKTNLNPAASWADSGRTVLQSNGTNSVTVSAPRGNDFFRLRGGP